MNWTLFLFSLAFAFVNVICAPDFTPCPSDNPQCLTEITRTVYKSVVKGNEELGIPSSDPMYHKRIEGNLDTVKYTLTNSTLTGFAGCDIDSVTVTPNKNSVNYKILCPNLRISGQYDINGTLIGVPIVGNGDYFIDTHDYVISVIAELKRIKGSDGQDHLSFKNFQLDYELKGGFEFELKNLFDGNKELADITKNFIKENWQAVAKLMDGPIVKSNFEVLLKNFNKYLKTIPAENFLKRDT